MNNHRYKGDWLKTYYAWRQNDTVFISVPMTFYLPRVRAIILQRDLFLPTNKFIIGGPGIYLNPSYFDDLSYVEVSYDPIPGMLQKYNPMATKTTLGCPAGCEFCAVRKIEPKFVELEEWPDLPVICDNNLCAATIPHFDRVMDRLEKHKDVDIQGVDITYLSDYHAERFSRCKKIKVRVALDSAGRLDRWYTAIGILRKHKIPKHSIKVFVLAGYKSDPSDAWERCEIVEELGFDAAPMWYHPVDHPVDSLKYNAVLQCHEEYGWNDFERRRLMAWFYNRKKIYN